MKGVFHFPYNGNFDLEAGTYFVEFARRGNNTGTYTLRGTFTPMR